MGKYVYFCILLVNAYSTVSDILSDSLHSIHSENFTCLDGLKIIPSIQLNDDYCDCADGSDEPSTAACPHGQFLCVNHGYRSKSIPSSRVNDGICDCCDASDENAQESNCPNTCLILSEKERKLRKSQEALIENGAALRTGLISKGKQLKSDRAKRLSELQQSKLEKELIKAEKEEIKRQAETVEAEALEAFKQQEQDKEPAPQKEEQENLNLLEAEQVFNQYDVNKDGFIEVEELQKDISLDKDRNGVVTIEEGKFFLNELDRLNLDDFASISWPLIKPYLMLSQGIFQPALVEGEKEDETNNLDADKLENLETEDLDGDDDIGEEADVEEDYDVEEKAAQPEYDPQTQSIIELANKARDAVSEVEREIHDIENEIKDIEDQNIKDYGPMEEYATLNGECFTYEDREYIYKLCPFDRASQQQLSGGPETILGRWDQWSGSADDKYSQMKYTNGISCWNGPQRSTIVQLKCALEQKITSVTEPNRCEYVFVFETPANCKELHNGSYQFHDEL